MLLVGKDLERQQADLFAKQFQDCAALLYPEVFAAECAPRDCNTCREAGELLENVAGLSDKLRLEVHDLDH